MAGFLPKGYEQMDEDHREIQLQMSDASLPDAESAGIAMQPTGVMGSSGAQTADRGERKRKAQQQHVVIYLILALLILILLLLCIVLGVMAARQSKAAAAHEAEASLQQSISTSLLLSTAGGLESTSGIRALLKSAEIAAAIGEPAIVSGQVLGAVSKLSQLPYLSLDLDHHRQRVTAVGFSPSGDFVASASNDGTISITPMTVNDAVSHMPLYAEPLTVELEGEVGAMQRSPSGTHIAASHSHRDGAGALHVKVGIWSFSPSSLSVTPAYILTIHKDKVRALAWSKDSAMLACGDNAGGLRVWMVAEAIASGSSQPPYHELNHPGSNDVRAVAFSPDGAYLAAGRTDEHVFLWDVSSVSSGIANPTAPAIVAVSPQHQDDITSVKFSPDGALLASASDAGDILLCDVAHTKWTMPPMDEDGSTQGYPILPRVNSDVSPTGGSTITGLTWTSEKQLVISSYDQTVKFYGIGQTSGEGVELQMLQELSHPDSRLTSVDVSADTTMVAAGTLRNQARIWRKTPKLGTQGPEVTGLSCRQELLDAYGQDSNSVRGASWSSDGARFAVSTYDGYLCLWERQVSKDFWKVAVAKSVTGQPLERRRPARTIEFSPQGDLLAVGDDSMEVHIWKRGTAGLWSVVRTYNHTGDVQDVAWSPDSLFLASASEDTTVGVLPLHKADSEPLLLHGHQGRVTSVSWRKDLLNGAYVLASGCEDSSIRLWQLAGSNSSDMLKLRSMSEVLTHADAVSSLAWSSLGLLASTSADGLVHIHSVDSADGTGVLESELGGGAGGIWAMDWSPDGQQLATAVSDSSVRVYVQQQAAPGHEYKMWKVPCKCNYLQWNEGSMERLSCGRSAEDAAREGSASPWTYMTEFLPVNLSDLLALLKKMTYGELTEQDMDALGFQGIIDFALQPLPA